MLTFQKAVVKSITPYLELDNLADLPEEKQEVISFMRIHRALNYLAFEEGLEVVLENGNVIQEEHLKRIFTVFQQIKSPTFYQEVRLWWKMVGSQWVEDLTARQKEQEFLLSRKKVFLIFCESGKPAFLKDFSYAEDSSEVELDLTFKREEAWSLPVSGVNQANLTVCEASGLNMLERLQKMGLSNVVSVKCLVISK